VLGGKPAVQVVRSILSREKSWFQKRREFPEREEKAPKKEQRRRVMPEKRKRRYHVEAGRREVFSGKTRLFFVWKPLSTSDRITAASSAG
jgi:hypothetical protein